MELLGVLIIVALTIGTGAIAGRKVKNSSDFTVAGKRNGTATVAGVIIGSLLGGSSTIGTAQVAYKYGMTAWWFTLGAGIGCIVLVQFLAKSLRAADVDTIPHFLRRSYGPAMRPGIAVADSIGIFLTIPAQITSAIALLTVILPIGPLATTITVAVLVALFCMTGGAISAGAAGLVKLVFIYLGLLAIGIVADALAGGPGSLLSGLPAGFLGLAGHGGGPGITDGVSTMIGVWCTQIYVLAVFSARSLGQARRGGYLAGLGMIVFGLGGVAAGLYMRKHSPGIPPVQALPLFVKENFGGLASGLVLGALLITVIACASSLALGIATMVTRDLYQNFRKSVGSERSIVWFARVVMVVVIVLAVLVVQSNVIKLVVTYSFLAFALRAATIAVPLLAVIAFPRSKYISPAGGITAAFVGLASDIILSTLGVTAPLYWAFGASILGLFVGGLIKPRSNRDDLTQVRLTERVGSAVEEAGA